MSYAYVIIGNDLVFDKERRKPIVNKDSYFDRNGYATASPEELDAYVKNIYYILLTWGIYGTHVYVTDPEPREYFKNYISQCSLTRD